MPAFLLTSVVFVIIWLGLLLFSAETRKEQVIMSLVGLVVSPGLLFISGSDPRSIVAQTTVHIGIEDLLFAATLFGIASVVYHFILGQHAHKLKGPRIQIAHPTVHWITHLLFALTIWVVVALLLLSLFNISATAAAAVGGLLVGMHILADRSDLLTEALLSGLLTLLLVLIVKQVFFVRLFPDAANQLIATQGMGSFILGGVPVEDLLWAAVVGFTIGPMYEHLRRLEWK